MMLLLGTSIAYTLSPLFRSRGHTISFCALLPFVIILISFHLCVCVRVFCCFVFGAQNKIISLLFAFAYYTHLFRFEHVFFRSSHIFRAQWLPVRIRSLTFPPRKFAAHKRNWFRWWPFFSPELFLYFKWIFRWSSWLTRINHQHICPTRQMTATIRRKKIVLFFVFVEFSIGAILLSLSTRCISIVCTHQTHTGKRKIKSKKKCKKKEMRRCIVVICKHRTKNVPLCLQRISSN